MGRTETAEYYGLRVIEISELQDDLAAGRTLAPFVHRSGLHAADMRKIDLEEALWPRKIRGRRRDNGRKIVMAAPTRSRGGKEAARVCGFPLR